MDPKSGLSYIIIICINVMMNIDDENLTSMLSDINMGISLLII